MKNIKEEMIKGSLEDGNTCTCIRKGTETPDLGYIRSILTLKYYSSVLFLLKYLEVGPTYLVFWSKTLLSFHSARTLEISRPEVAEMVGLFLKISNTILNISSWINLKLVKDYTNHKILIIIILVKQFIITHSDIATKGDNSILQ